MVVTTVYGLQLFLFLGAGYFSFTASQDDVLRLDDDNRDLKRLKIAKDKKKSLEYSVGRNILFAPSASSSAIFGGRLWLSACSAARQTSCTS